LLRIEGSIQLRLLANSVLITILYHNFLEFHEKPASLSLLEMHLIPRGYERLESVILR
jgi:hypothetical protein